MPLKEIYAPNSAKEINSMLHEVLGKSPFLSRSALPDMASGEPRITFGLNMENLNRLRDGVNLEDFFTKRTITHLYSLLQDFGDFRAYGKEAWLDEYSKFRLEFKEEKSFFKFAGTLAKIHGLTDEERISIVAHWAGELREYYDQDKSDSFLSGLSSPSPSQMIQKIQSGGKAGICGDINGAFAKELARHLGLGHASILRWSQDSAAGHIVGLLKGSQGYYLVDYSKAAYLGKDPDTAMELLLSHYGGFTPLSTSIDSSTRFYSPPSQEVLFEAINFANLKIEDGLGVKVHARNDGSSYAKLSSKISSFNYGAFYLNTPFSLKNSFGSYINYRTSKGEDGAIWLPELDLAVFSGGASAATAIVQTIPLRLKWAPIKNMEIRFDPLRIAGAYSGEMRAVVSSESNIGFVYKLDKFSEIYSDITLGYCPGKSRFYDPRDVSTASEFSAGVKFAGTKLDAKYRPDALIHPLEITAEQRIYSGKYIPSLVVFASARYNDANSSSLSFGAQIFFGK